MFKNACVSVFILSSIVLMTPQYAGASPIDNVEWCLRGDATNRIKDQPLGVNNGECIKWIPKYGFRFQKELAQEAVSLAKGGDNSGAIERLIVCQCHNGSAQSDINANQSAIIEYLKKQ